MTTLGPLVLPTRCSCTRSLTRSAPCRSRTDRGPRRCARWRHADGSIQLAFGMGKYTNRGVLDAYAGVSRGKEQWTVRSSRRLAPEVERLESGPIRYEILEPLHWCASASPRTTRFPSPSSGRSVPSYRSLSNNTSTIGVVTGSGSTRTSCAITRSAPRPVGSSWTASDTSCSTA